MTHQEPISAANLERLLSRRVPWDKRQRTAMSCDFCKRKRCKCSRPKPNEPCRACVDNGEVCQITEPRKKRTYPDPRGMFPVPMTGSYDVRQVLPQILAKPTLDQVSGQRSSPPTTSQDQKGATGAQSQDQVRSRANTSQNEKRKDKSSRLGVVGRRKKATNGEPYVKVAVAEAFFEDTSGMPQYIGPAGSYSLLVSLRQMLSIRCAPMAPRPEAAQTMGSTILIGGNSASDQVDEMPPRHVSDHLVDMFFTSVHRDFPVFHRALFLASYEAWWTNQSEADPAWLMALYMVYALALEASPDNRSGGQRLAAQARYLGKAKRLLPDVIADCTLSHVQALMLYCLQLHISRERNACWNIIGSAVRIAIAIGLHRNGTNPKCSPLERELRKRVWWTLFAFETIECSSLGRPSAIHYTECNAPVPTEGLLDMGDIIPIGYFEQQADLLELMSKICENQYGLHDPSEEHIKFAWDISKRLREWFSSLPPHLKDKKNCPRSQLRSIVLLHIQYQYATTLLTRSCLAAKTSRDANANANANATASNTTGSTSSYNDTVDTLARTCAEAAATGMTLLGDLLDNSCFNSKTSWDVYYMESFAMILALAKFAYESEENGYPEKILASLELGIDILQKCDGFSPTMDRFATVTRDLSQTVVTAIKTASNASSNPSPASPEQRDVRVDEAPTNPQTSMTRSGNEQNTTPLLVHMQDDPDVVQGFDFLDSDLVHSLDFLDPAWAEPLGQQQVDCEMSNMNHPISWEDFGHWVLQQQ